MPSSNRALTLELNLKQKLQSAAPLSGPCNKPDLVVKIVEFWKNIKSLECYLMANGMDFFWSKDGAVKIKEGIYFKDHTSSH